MRNEDYIIIKFIIFLVVLIFSIGVSLWVAKKYFEKSVYETFKTIGVKALAFFAIFNIFASNNDLHDDSSDTK